MKTNRGIVPLLIAGIVAVVTVLVTSLGLGVTLVATGNKSQVVPCLEGDIPHDMAVVGMLVGALDGSGTFDLATVLAGGGPIALCELQALAADEKLDLQQNAAVQAAAKAALAAAAQLVSDGGVDAGN